jgi:ribonuclease HI
MTVHAYIDGATRGNPGESGIGVVLKNQTGAILESISGYIGKATNNIAEYSALLVCLNKAIDLNCKHLIVFSDSELLVRQMNRQYRVKNEGIKKVYQHVQRVLSKSAIKFEIKHIDRERNKDADLLANAGINSRRRIKV